MIGIYGEFPLSSPRRPGPILPWAPAPCSLPGAGFAGVTRICPGPSSGESCEWVATLEGSGTAAPVIRFANVTSLLFEFWLTVSGAVLPRPAVQDHPPEPEKPLRRSEP
jgi:hypothetical protein